MEEGGTRGKEVVMDWEGVNSKVYIYNIYDGYLSLGSLLLMSMMTDFLSMFLASHSAVFLTVAFTSSLSLATPGRAPRESSQREPVWAVSGMYAGRSQNMAGLVSPQCLITQRKTMLVSKHVRSRHSRLTLSFKQLGAMTDQPVMVMGG